MRTCQYCHLTISRFRLILAIHTIGSDATTALGSPSPAGIISVYRHHPLAVCDFHYHNLPVHVRHHTNQNSYLPRGAEVVLGGPPPPSPSHGLSVGDSS
jgi:hypothetical protein